MTAYYIVFVLTLILCKAVPANTDRDYWRKLLIVFTPLFLFGALRVDFGIDYSVYETEYYQVHAHGTIDKEMHNEIGYQWLEILMPSWRMMLILTSFVTCFSWAYIFRKYVNRQHLTLAICLFFIAGNFTFYTPVVTMRNGLAIACMLLSTELIVQRRLVPAFTIAFLAHYLHSSVLLFMPIAILVGLNKKWTKKETYIWMAVFAALFFLGAGSIMERLTSFIWMYFERYGSVLEEMKQSTHNSLLVSLANVMLFAGLLSVMNYNKETLSKSDNTIFRIGIIYLICPFLGSLGTTRMQCYFLPFFVLTVVRMYTCQWKNSMFKTAFFTLVFAYYFYSFFYVWQWKNPNFAFQTYKCILGVF